MGFLHITSATIGELLAIRTGLEVAHARHLPSIILESDCLPVTREIVKEGASFIDGGCIIKGIKLLLVSLPSCVVKYVDIEANKLAHNVAKFPAEKMVIWEGGLPPVCLNRDLNE
ncbi:hypothetical protein REPUB_Repub14bG0049900 [Reevesia pubescens]